MREVFTVSDRKWRGIGEIAQSGLVLREEYAAHDAERVFQLDPLHVEEPRECISALVLQGHEEAGRLSRLRQRGARR